MLTKKLIPAAVTAALLSTAGVAQADEDSGVMISGNVTLTSDYKFRGISQSDESPAIQGGFDVEFATGIYLGAWGSSVDFDSNDGYDGSLELDYYAGWAGMIGDTEIGLDVGILYYDYPGDNGDEGDYGEVYLSSSWKDLTVGVHYSDDYYAETDEFWYLYADYGFTLPGDYSLSFHVGYNMLEEDGGFLSSDEDAYTDYSVSVSKEMWGVEWALAYTGTDLDDDDVFGTDWGDGQAIFSISKSM